MKNLTLKMAILAVTLIIISSGFNTSFSANMKLKKENDVLPVFFDFDNLPKNDEYSKSFIGSRDDKDFLFGHRFSSDKLSFVKTPQQITEFIPGEIIVKFKSDINLEITLTSDDIQKIGISSIDILNKNFNVLAIEKLFKQSKKQDINSLGLSNICKFTIPKDCDILSIVDEYKKDSNVEYAQPNYIMKTQLIPNDYFYHSSGSWGKDFDDLWGLKKIFCEDAWEISTGLEEIIVAVVDSGVDYKHSDISDNMWINEDEIPDNGIDDDNDGFIDNIYGADIVNDDGDPMDNYGHGTHCAGTIAAVGNNNIGVVGVNWKAKIMAVKGGNGGGGTIEDLTEGIYWAADQGANVISNSWGPTSRMPSNPLAEDVVRYAYSKGCVVVFAAGNDNDDVMYYSPANMYETISVAATTYMDLKADFSNWGELIDLCAPGVDILSLRANGTGVESHIVNDNYYYANGTSMSCPHVAGLAALLLSKNPTLSPDEVKTILKENSDKVYSTFPIGGRINAKKVLWDDIAIAEINIGEDWTDITNIMEISGTANGLNFQKYLLEFGKGKNPSSWNLIITSTNMVENNVLGILDTNALTDGIYTLKLSVLCDEGLLRDIKYFVVNNNKDIYVVDDDNPNANYNHIQDAIYDAGKHDTIYVKSGIYFEHLIIDRPINLIGENKETTTLQGYMPQNYIIQIYSNGVVVENFTFNCYFSDIWLTSSGVYVCSNDTVITSNRFQNLAYGIYSIKSSNNNFNKNFVKNSFYGIFISWGSNNSLCENTIIGNSFGILLYNNSNNFLSTNMIIKNNDYGIFFIESLFNKITNNIFENNGIILMGDDLSHWNTHVIENNHVNNKQIVYYKNVNNISINKQDIGQLILANCSGFNISNLIVNDAGIGIQLGFSSLNTFLNNSLNHNLIGLDLCNSNNNHIINCNFIKNKGIGSYIESNSQNNKIEYCKYYENSNSIVIILSRNNIITANNISYSNLSGIYLDSCNYNMCIMNQINENDCGIRLSSASNNTIKNNDIIDNKKGIKIYESLEEVNNKSINNKIYINSFINNIENAYDPHINQWYDASLMRGNYWSDFDDLSENAYDNNSDGIIDLPYNIPGDNNKDIYPLIVPYESKPPNIKITRPEKALYLFNFKIRDFLIKNKPLIIGEINITVETSDDESGVMKIELYIDNDLKASDTEEPYYFIWEEKSLFRHKHKITVKAYDKAGNNKTDEITVRKYL